MCHAATWMINGVRDGHGSFWKLYARKATLVHPELPMVTRCHTYEIKYKFQYQCTRCKNTYVPTSMFTCIQSRCIHVIIQILIAISIFVSNDLQTNIIELKLFYFFMFIYFID